MNQINTKSINQLIDLIDTSLVSTSDNADIIYGRPLPYPHVHAFNPTRRRRRYDAPKLPSGKLKWER